MQKIGFSNGALYKATDVTKPQAIRDIYSVAPDCIEIYAHNEPGRMDISEEYCFEVKKFARRSVHTLTNIKYKRNGETAAILQKINKMYSDIGAELAVIHGETVDDWSVFDDSPMQLAIENGDNRKDVFKDVDSLRNFLIKHENWKMVLDLNHCFANDPTMKLADDIIKNLGHKIAQIHLSGFAGFHEPLFQTRQLEILRRCRGLDVPIVIESVLSGVEDLKTEYDYIMNNL